MQLEDFLNCRVQILNYVKKGTSAGRWNCPRMLSFETSFPCSTQSSHTKYAEKQRVVETNIFKPQEFFKGCHNADVHGGENKRIVDTKRKADEHGKLKKEDR